MSEIHRQGDLAPFPSKMLYLIKPHFFFLKQEKLQRGKKVKQQKVQKYIIRWNGQILTSIEGKIKLFKVFEWTFTKESKGKINHPDCNN